MNKVGIKMRIASIGIAVATVMSIGFASSSQAAEKDAEPIVTVNATVGIV